jgi:putative addiction module component (TIGR02574 family)
MASKVEEVTAQALSLTATERAQLVNELLTSLDQEIPEEVEVAWVEEAERRYREAQADPSAAESATAAFERARAALK